MASQKHASKKARPKRVRLIKPEGKSRVKTPAGPPPRAHRPRTPQPPKPPKPFSIVGIGASAGGLEALEKFFANVPADCGLAFVVVTHQHPGHVSLLPELLGKCTSMRVMAVEDGVAVEPNRVYMSLPENYLAIHHGNLHLMETDEPGTLRLPIDYFFRSLAEDQKEKAVGIILSGTGTDGTIGLKAIKSAAGMTMAQQPDSAKYSGMPASAIATGLVDYAQPVEQLPRQLIAYAGGLHLVLRGHEPAADDELSELMQKITTLLRTRSKTDFSLYKANTIRRRIERRINVHQIKGPQQYLRLLQENPHELDLLFKELLIGVTNFFRDPKAFAALTKIIVPRLLAKRADDSPVRVWTPGCSTGEEVFTLAMILVEGMERLKVRVPVQIFATDLDNEAIETARGGIYTDGIAADVGAHRLARFFTKEDGGYRIKKEIREMIIFAPQNVLKDPPFTKLDLVTCRNLLIYLKPDAQERLLALFHYALRPGGMLFLGTSESLTSLSDQFTIINKQWKIFMRKETAVHHALPAGFSTPAAKDEEDSNAAVTAATRIRKQQFSMLLEKTLLSRYAPASVIVNDRGDILYIHGRTGDYLEPATGQPRLNIQEMAREGLGVDLSSALRRAAAQTGEVVHEGVRVKTNGNYTSVRLTVVKLNEPEAVRGLLLVTFQPEPAGKRPAGKRPAGRASELERELEYTRETLQSTVEQLQTSNEELKSTNEELQSTNEELQSANEELETSKEEMQSLNEELQTVNAQLQSKLDDLAHANDDMQNLLNGTAIATVFLDQKLRIKRFTAEATKLVKFIPSDVGRPIGDLASNLRYDQLQADAAEVLQKLAGKEKEVQTKDGEWRLVHISPYRTTENVIDGLVVTFTDINRLKLAEQASQTARVYAENIIATVREPLLVLDENLRVVSANRAFYNNFKTSAPKVECQLVYEINDGQWNIPALRRLLEEILPRNASFDDVKVEQDFPGLGRKRLLLNARRLKRAPGDPGMILLAFEALPAENDAARKPPRRRKGSTA